VLSSYASQLGHYTAGQIIEVTEGEALFLMNDAPGVFEIWKPATTKKALDKPATNKAIASAPLKKSK